MALTSTAEDYLEQIYLLSLRIGTVKSSDIARELGIRTPSVVDALKLLKRKGLVRYERYGPVTLSEKGLAKALDVYERHKTLYRFLRFVVGVDDKIASHDACGMEHSASPETLAGLKDLLAYLSWKKDQGVDIQEEIRSFRARRKAEDPERDTMVENEPATLPLSEAADGVAYEIVSVVGDQTVRRRLFDMGMIPGAKVSIRSRGPMGFPMEVLVHEYVLTLRKDEAESVLVKGA